MKIERLKRMNHRIKVRWMKWRSLLRVLCDSKIYTKLKRKFYKTSIRHALFNDTRCWTIKKQHINEMNVIKVKNIKMKKWKKRR